MDEKKKTLKDHFQRHWFTGFSLSSLGGWWIIDPLTMKEILGHAMEQEITKLTIAFIIAWKIVKRDMKRDMGEEFAGLRYEISKLGDGLKSHTSRLDKLEEIVSQLKTLYEKLIGGMK